MEVGKDAGHMRASSINLNAPDLYLTSALCFLFIVNHNNGDSNKSIQQRSASGHAAAYVKYLGTNPTAEKPGYTTGGPFHVHSGQTTKNLRLENHAENTVQACKSRDMPIPPLPSAFQ